MISRCHPKTGWKKHLRPPPLATRRHKMNFTRLPSELQLLVAENLQPRELSYLVRANQRFHSLFTPILDRLAQEPKEQICALGWAVLRGYTPLVQLLLSKGRDINHIEAPLYSYFGTALHTAVFSRRLSLIRLFLENPTLDLNKLDTRENTALHIAIECCDLEVVKLLHAAGADPEIANEDGVTALLLAFSCRHLEVMEFLLRNGANVNARFPGGTWLHATLLQGLVRFGDSERLVRLALERGADPEVRNYQNQRAIDIAFAEGKTKLVEILREVSLPLDVGVDTQE
ncbi:ankyrin [Choiromyces venosus 120613-1]|uniref:Ankyrin n=1 Tax=Choiromyces venosus 120613-1 TaxID=1336337 RepID=A0A3N4JW27_9PEZI|nr:ankyrin [Choiromyces venosus 120613-1]